MEAKEGHQQTHGVVVAGTFSGLDGAPPVYAHEREIRGGGGGGEKEEERGRRGKGKGPPPPKICVSFFFR